MAGPRQSTEEAVKHERSSSTDRSWSNGNNTSRSPRKRLGGAGDPRKTLEYPDNGTNENNYNTEERTGIVKRLTIT